MITKIIAVSDLHVRNILRMDETREQFGKFIDETKKIVEENGAENTRIVICGDLVHSKLTIASECYMTVSWFLSELDNVCKTIVVAGNHDLNMSNLDRLDSLTPVFEMSKFKQVIFIDRELGYKSGTLEDDNIVWCLFSTFDNFLEPEFKKKEGKTYVGLFHGDTNGAVNASGIALSGLEPKYFKKMDFTIAGHIHKCQEIKTGKTKMVYCGSLIQQDNGESISGHGYVLWTIPENEWKLVEIPNENYGFYKFKIAAEDDIDNDKETLLNE